MNSAGNAYDNVAARRRASSLFGGIKPSGSIRLCPSTLHRIRPGCRNDRILEFFCRCPRMKPVPKPPSKKPLARRKSRPDAYHSKPRTDEGKKSPVSEQQILFFATDESGAAVGWICSMEFLRTKGKMPLSPPMEIDGGQREFWKCIDLRQWRARTTPSKPSCGNMVLQANSPMRSIELEVFSVAETELGSPSHSKV